MQSKVKANSIVTHRLINDTTIGFTVVGYDEVTLDLTKVAASNRTTAEFHGWGQRIPDVAAVGVTDKDGVVIPKSTRTRMKYERIKSIIAHYESGSADWSRKSTGPRIIAEDHTLTIAALMALHGMTHEAVQEFVIGKAKSLNVSRTAVLDSFAAVARVAAKVAELRAERVAAAGIDEDSLFEGLEGGEAGE